MDSNDVVGRTRELERVRVRLVETVYDVDLLDDRAHRIPALERRGNVDGPELRGDYSLVRSSDVGMQRRREFALILPDVDFPEVILRPFLVLIRKVVVSVDQRHFTEDVIDPRGDVVGLRVCGSREKDDRESDGVQTSHGAIR